eukprot:2203403-Rhodomonas_salina.1
MVVMVVVMMMMMVMEVVHTAAPLPTPHSSYRSTVIEARLGVYFRFRVSGLGLTLTRIMSGVMGYCALNIAHSPSPSNAAAAQRRGGRDKG